MLRGIDISNNNGHMDLDGVPFDFAICKATEGTGFVDAYCDGYMEQVLGSGRLAGVYHFARTGDPVEQAEVFVDAIRGYVGKALLALDWENAGDYDTEVLSQGPGWALEWLDRVTELTGVRPLIYMSKGVCRAYDWSDVAGSYALWCAQYPNYVPTGYQDDPWTDPYGWGAWSGPAIYQYTSSGDLPGYGGDLDLNVFYGDAGDWARFCGSARPEQRPGEPVNSAGLSYHVHVQDMGDLPTVRDGQVAGTTGFALRMEGIVFDSIPEGWQIRARYHLQDEGWKAVDVRPGALIGSRGESRRMEDIGFEVLSKPEGDRRRLHFQAHQQNTGWLGETLDGYSTGCDGQSLRLEAFRAWIA